ncbi:MAG: 50S ribosomal protein L29 [Bacteroidota bacterium]
MKYAEIKDLALAEIMEKLELERESLAKLKLNHAISPLENPRILGERRRNVARLLTEVRRRELENKAE